MIQFFLHMIPPTVTHQEKKISTRGQRPIVYEPPELKETRAKLTAHLQKHCPEKPYTDAVRLVVKWCFPVGRHSNGAYKTTRPDTDNLQKLLKDCMTTVGFWSDDALVASEVCEKFWAEVPGIFVAIEELSHEG